MRGSAHAPSDHPGQLAERRSALPVTSNGPGVTILHSLEMIFWKKPLWILIFSPKKVYKVLKINKEIMELESQNSFEFSYVNFSSLSKAPFFSIPTTWFACSFIFEKVCSTSP